MSAPDRTTKITRALREIDAQSPRKFVWPAPPYYEYQGGPPPEGEPCLLTFTDGGKATGLLQNFLPEHEILKFHPENGTSAVTIAFSGLLTLQLLERVAIADRHGPPPARKPEAKRKRGSVAVNPSASRGGLVAQSRRRGRRDAAPTAPVGLAAAIP